MENNYSLLFIGAEVLYIFSLYIIASKKQDICKVLKSLSYWTLVTRHVLGKMFGFHVFVTSVANIVLFLLTEWLYLMILLVCRLAHYIKTYFCLHSFRLYGYFFDCSTERNKIVKFITWVISVYGDLCTIETKGCLGIFTLVFILLTCALRDD